MKTLFLSPQPFYQDRGSPIAVRMVLELMSQRGEEVDVLVFHEGRDLPIDGINIFRTPSLPFIRNIRPGFSWKKLICDFLMLILALRCLLRKRYDMIYAVEEAVFIALLAKMIFKIPYVYDMDSSLPEQLLNQYPFLEPVKGAFRKLEAIAVSNAQGVLPVCQAIVDTITPYQPHRLALLNDVPYIPTHMSETLSSRSIESASIRRGREIPGPVIMYVGNLEQYQGIDLMLEGFALANKQGCMASLVVVGGLEADVAKYEAKAQTLGLTEHVHFLGAAPIEHLGSYLEIADILSSPRLKGTNTPMKVYAYMASGKPIIATNLETHTQVLTPESALLVEPTVTDFARGLVDLLSDPDLCERLGTTSKRWIDEKYNYATFAHTFNEFIDGLRHEITGELPIYNSVGLSNVT